MRYSTTLPSGRKVVSEWMRKDDMKANTVITWCEFIREQVDIDQREKAAEKKRGRVDVPEQIEEEVREDSVSDATNPVDFAKHQRDLYQDRQSVLEERYAELKIQIKQNRHHLEQWEKIVDSLRGEVDD